MAKVNIVYVTPKPPYPLTGGMEIRQFNLLRAYAEWGRVHLVTFEDDRSGEGVRRLQPHCASVHAAPATTVAEGLASGSRLRRLLYRIGGWRPCVVRLSHSPEVAGVIERLAVDADIVHVARLHMASHVERLLGNSSRRPRMILDLDDDEASFRLRQLRLGRHESLAHRAFGYYDAVRLWAYQRRALSRFDSVFVCSERDRRRLARPNVVVVPNGTAVPTARPPQPSRGRTIIFCGQLAYPPNVDGLQHFVTSVFPRIQRVLDDVRLLIVGRAPIPEIRALHDGKAIVVAGDVASVAEYYAMATVAVVPLRFGGGTRLKILEAWAHGVPVVSSTLGCEGLDGVHGRHLMVADRSEDFAGRCVALLQSPDLRERIAAEAWRLACERYRWEDIGARTVAHLRRLVGDHAERHDMVLNERVSPEHPAGS